MAAVYSIAVVGDWESVMGFRALGLDTYPVTSVEEARKTVHELAKTDCAVIYLTETLAKDMPMCWSATRISFGLPSSSFPDGRAPLESAWPTSRAPLSALWVRTFCKK